MTRSVSRWSRTGGLRTLGAGYTFIELLIVVTIISILAAIAMPAYSDYELRAEAAEALIFLGDAKVAVNEFHGRWGRMPANNREAGLRAPETLRGKYLRRLDVAGGVLVATLELGHDLAAGARERTLTLRPWVNAGTPAAPILWSCGEYDPKAPPGYRVVGDLAENPVEAKFVPGVCRK